MGFNGVRVAQLNGGLGRRNPSTDGTALLIIGAGVATSALAVKTVVQFVSIDNAEAVGITPAYDDANNILAHHHIDEFFRLSPDGELLVVFDDGSLTADNIKTIVRSNLDIKFGGVVRNSSTAVVLADEVAKYQLIVNQLRSENIYFDGFMIEGNTFDNSVLVSAYEDLRALNAPNVSVVVSQDPVIRNLKTAYAKYASIGSALGMLSVRRVNENLGSVNIERKPLLKRGDRDYPLTDINRKRFISTVLQSGVDVNELSKADKNLLTQKGYIYAGSYQGYGGIFFNSSPTCVSATSDYAYIENNRVWGKAARLLINILTPRIKSNILKDPNTGNIRVIEAKELEALGLKELNTMVASEEISGADVYINPAQDLSETSPLIIKVSLVINGIIYEINIDLGLTKNIG